MSNHWEQVRWKDVSVQHGGPHESGLLKLNCDKALHHLGWQAAWNFEVTVRETALWYKRFYENKTDQSLSFKADCTLKQLDCRVSGGQNECRADRYL